MVMLGWTGDYDGSAAAYPRRVLDGFGRELLKAAALRQRFFAPGFARRMVRYAAWSPALRDVLRDLVLGEQAARRALAATDAGATVARFPYLDNYADLTRLDDAAPAPGAGPADQLNLGAGFAF